MRITLVATERGGDVTYHGPGQLVVYPILDLRTFGLGVRGYIQRLEQTAIDLLESYGIQGMRREGTPGVWVEDRKIASVGAFVGHWVTMHGLAINIAPDLHYFDLIVPCGLEGVRMTSMKEENRGAVLDSRLIEAYVRNFSCVFDCDVRLAGPNGIERTLAPDPKLRSDLSRA